MPVAARVPGFEGGQTPLARRLPKLPGFRNFNRVEYLPVNVSRLDAKFEAGDVVDGESLKAKGIIKHADALVKVLGDGEITKALTVRVDKVSASAKAKIEAARRKGRRALLSSIIDAFKVPELRKKILFTLAILALYRFGAYRCQAAGPFPP